jgi:hypothetical protein
MTARWDGLETSFRRHRDQRAVEVGTTWTQMMCALLVFQTADLPAPLATPSPWLLCGSVRWMRCSPNWTDSGTGGLRQVEDSVQVTNACLAAVMRQHEREQPQPYRNRQRLEPHSEQVCVGRRQRLPGQRSATRPVIENGKHASTSTSFYIDIGRCLRQADTSKNVYVRRRRRDDRPDRLRLRLYARLHQRLLCRRRLLLVERLLGDQLCCEG